MTGKIGVAISTTGDEHRLRLLAHCVEAWDAALPFGSSLSVTVDGDEAACARVLNHVWEWTGSVFRVGQPWGVGPYDDPHEGRLGVAVNKNTGIELLMGHTGLHPVEHLFLSDDDTWPLSPASLDLHTTDALAGHSMVCWGYHRLIQSSQPWAEWSWPRGCMIYTHRNVIDQVGGLVEAFGLGGHEHVEWSRRIHQAGLTPCLYPSPLMYAQGHKAAMGAASYWHAEDMPHEHEGIAAYAQRKETLTSVRRRPGDWEKIEALMTKLDGDTSFKSYWARDNGRGSATLYDSSRA